MSLVYTAKVKLTGGRAGTAKSDDNQLAVDLRLPRAFGGDGAGTNPEQLLAAGYAACFESTIGFVAANKKVPIESSSVTASVDLHSDPTGAFIIKKIDLQIELRGPSPQTALELIEEAKKLCPYHKLVQNNTEQAYRLV